MLKLPCMVIFCATTHRGVWAPYRERPTHPTSIRTQEGLSLPAAAVTETAAAPLLPDTPRRNTSIALHERYLFYYLSIVEQYKIWT